MSEDREGEVVEQGVRQKREERLDELRNHKLTQKELSYFRERYLENDFRGDWEDTILPALITNAERHRETKEKEK